MDFSDSITEQRKTNTVVPNKCDYFDSVQQRVDVLSEHVENLMTSMI